MLKATDRFHMIHKKSNIALLLGALPLCAATAASEVVLNPNQITGTIKFSNSSLANPNPQVAEYLKQFQFNSQSWVKGSSVNENLSVNSYPGASAENTTELPYELTVSTSEAGEPYQIAARANLTRASYWFDSQISAPVFPEPAENVSLDFSECAAIVDVTYVDSSGAPADVTGRVFVDRVVPNRVGNVYYRNKSNSSQVNGVNRLQVPVNGNNEEYIVRSRYSYGSYTTNDSITYECRESITPSCDTVVALTCQVASGDQLGSIEGIFDIEGEQVRQGRLNVRASSGPFSNVRTVDLETPGNFALQNIVPSDAEETPKGYNVRGYAEFRAGDNAHRYFTPNRYYKQVMVESGQATDVAQNYVIKPSYVRGDILLFGPTDGEQASGLNNLVFGSDIDHDGDGFPDSYYWSGVAAYGSSSVAAGATYSAIGGDLVAAFKGSMDENNTFNSQYEMAIGGLNGQNSIWSLSQLLLRFDHPEPELDNYAPLSVGIFNTHYVQKELAPGQVYEGIDHQYCFSDITLNYRATTGKFYRPSAMLSGRFNGTDFMNNAANYYVSAHNAYGLPMSLDQAAPTGLVNFTLPQGIYSIRPSVSVVNEDGTTNVAQLPTVEVEVGCAQKIDISTGLQIQFDQALPQEVADSQLSFSGSVTSSDTVSQIVVNVNNTGEKVLCSDGQCGDTFSGSVKLQEGDNSVVVSATDVVGNIASISSSVRYIPAKLTLSCANISVNIAALASGANVDYQLATESNCDSAATVSCSPDSGSLFGVGSSTVSCTAKNSCGAQASCQFTVEVTQDEPEEPEVPQDTCDGVVANMTQSLDSASLWPANHKMVDLTVVHQVTDDCGEAVENPDVITEVWSNEPEIFMHAAGGGNTSPDAIELDDSLQLRAERFGTGNGRVYLVISKDVDGNTFACSTVTVPHDQSETSLARIASDAAAAEDYCQEHDGLPVTGYFKHGVAYPESNGNGNGSGGNGQGGNGNGGNDQGGNGNGGNDQGGNGNGGDKDKGKGKGGK